MATAADQIRRFQLPTRIQATAVPSDGYLPRLALADRIAELPGILTVEDEADASRFSGNVYLNPVPGIHGKHALPIRFCSIDHDGLRVFGLQDRDQMQLVNRGWGKIDSGHAVVYLPRNGKEVETCWLILFRAYESLHQQSIYPRPGRVASPWTLPYFSKTKLQ